MSDKKRRYIVHVDMDAFFAAVEQRDTPSYRERPVVVGADPKKGKGRGVVSTCSYEARKYGIHSAMPISMAYRNCPDAVFLPVYMEKYVKESQKIFSILKEFTPVIEKLSIDEAFLDITGSYHLIGTPEETVKKLKKRIKEETGLTASAGLAPNKFTAKIASDLKKPDGLVVVEPDKIREFLNPLGVEKIWGAGEKTVEKLHSLGIYKIGDLAARPTDEIVKHFGKNGLRMSKLSRGEDDREVETVSETKSVSNEYTFSKDTSDFSAINSVLLRLSDKVSRRLRKAGLKGRTVSLKIRLSGFENFTRSKTLEKDLNYTEDIFNVVSELYNAFCKKELKRKKPKEKLVRLIGVKVSNFKTKPIARQQHFDIFNSENDDSDKEDMYRAIERIRDKHGADIIRPASAANLKKKKDER